MHVSIPGRFGAVVGVAVGAGLASADGLSGYRLAVSCPSGAGWLRIFDAESGALLDVTRLDYAPAGFAEGRDGSIMVFRQNDGPIYRYDRTSADLLGVFMQENAAGALQARDIAFMPTGDLLVTGGSANRIARVDGLSGAYTGDFVPPGLGGLERCFGVTFRPNGNLVAASHDSDSVLEYEGSTGAFVRTLVSSGAGGLDTPYDVTFSPAGKLLVSEVGSGRILAFDGWTGDYLGDFTTVTLPGARALVVGPNGNLFVCSWDGPQGPGVYEFDGVSGALRRQVAEASGAMFAVFLRDCRGDLSGSSDPADPRYGLPDGHTDAADFFFFLDLFTAQDSRADYTGSSNPFDPAWGVPDGWIDASDFFYFLDLFAVGCP